MPIVTMPDGTSVSFPADMPADRIKSLIASKFPNETSKVEPGILDQIAGFANKYLMQGVPEDQRASDQTASYIGSTLANVPSSAAQFASDTIQPIIHPIETAENIGKIGKGVLQKLGIMSGTDSEQYANAVGKFLVDRYGSGAAIKKTLNEDPVGVLADVSTVLSAGGTAAGRIPGVAGKVAKVASETGRAIDPLNAVAGAAKAGGSLAAEAAGISTGVGSEALKTAAKAGAEGGQGGKAFLDNLTGAANPNDVVAEAKYAVSQLRQERGQVYRQEMAKIGANNTVLNFQKVDNAVQNVAGVKTYKGQVLSPKTDAIRQELIGTVNDWKALNPADFHTAEGLDALKQKIGDIRDATQPGTPDRLVADNVYKAVYNTITDQAPEYAKVMKGYEEASSLIREMEKTLSLNPKASIDTQLRKLQSALRNNVNTNYGRRAELVDFLQRAGAPNLMQKLAGQMLSSAAPRGLGRVLAGGEGFSALAALASGNPAVAAALGGGIAASSPLLTGATAYGLGASTRLPLRTLGRSAFQAGRISQQ
jgi:hypothetical protein